MSTGDLSRDCRMLMACRLAYTIQNDGKLDPEKSKPLLKEINFQGDPTVIVGGPLKTDAAVVGRTEGNVVVAFRGTLPPNIWNPQTWADWYNDIFNDEPIEVGVVGGKVHKGFWNSVQAIWDQVAQAVELHQHTGPCVVPVLYTGHSKGGSMADLAAARSVDLPNNDPYSPKVVTFAASRAGDGDFVNYFNQAVTYATRYEFGNDIVPHLPPTETFFERLNKELPPFWGDFLKPLAEKGIKWNYTPVGKLQFIEWDKTTIVPESDALEKERDIKLGKLLTNPDIIATVNALIQAHSIDCGGGYLTGTCPGFDCSKE